MKTNNYTIEYLDDNRCGAPSSLCDPAEAEAREEINGKPGDQPGPFRAIANLHRCPRVQHFLHKDCPLHSQVYTASFCVLLLPQFCIIERQHVIFDRFGSLPSVRPLLLFAELKTLLWRLLRKHSSKGGCVYGNKMVSAEYAFFESLTKL
jgi:hypothetical protein